MVFDVLVGFLFVRPAMVFQSMCMFVLWSQLSSRCCFQRLDLCSCMSLSMLLLITGSVGSLGLCCLMVSLRAMRSLMFCGKSLCLLCILPLGMWCLSALSMMIVSMLFAT